jgi:iron complex transport system ATP-binding protein
MFLLRKIAESGKGIIISTHDFQISTQLSDRLWLFNFQEKAVTGVPEDLIINHTLEKVLYLQDFGYDLMHSRVVFPTTNRSIRVSGPETLRFWTEQALTRNGYRLQEESMIQVNIADGHWILNTKKGHQTLNSIEALLTELKNHSD